MDDNASRAGLVRARSGTQHERDSGFLSGLVDLLPRLGYRGLLPSVSFVRQEQRPLLPIAAQTRQHSRAASEDSNIAESISSTQDSTEQQLQAEQSEVSTSGRDGQEANQQTESPAAAAERHRMGSANSFDLQVQSVDFTEADSVQQLWTLCSKLAVFDCGLQGDSQATAT